MDRVDGWEEALLADHGIVDEGRGLGDAQIRWTIENLPDPGMKGSLSGTFGTWIYRLAETEFTSSAWERRRNLGRPSCYFAAWKPWSTTREGTDGARWNFWWTRNPCAYVWSPDHKLRHAEMIFAEHPRVAAQEPVAQWLARLADSWLRLEYAAHQRG
jgi:hypothetical protein